jgi:glycosyltransferase involved in cell wall biosynthesis
VSGLPLVSVVLPTLNGRRYIESSIASCLGQTFANFELLVVDGGSSDGTLDVVRSIADDRIRILRQRDNVDRLPGALNTGFAEARGSYFTWTQDDDLYGRDALRVMVDALDAEPGVGMVYTGQVFIDATGNKIRNGLRFPPDALTWTNPIGHCFLYRRSVAEEVGGYDPRFLMSEDTHYWLRIFRRAPIVQLPGVHFSHRLHPDSLTCRGYGAYEALRVAARARREVLGLDRRVYRRQVADAYVEEAFAADQRRDGRHALQCLLNAAWLRAGSVVRPGVVSLTARSLAGAARR